MEKVILNNVYYQQNSEVKEYIDIFFDTDRGVLKYNLTSLDIVDTNNFLSMMRVDDIDKMKSKYGLLFIDEVRKTYDNDMYFLISGKWILAIEYILNSTLNHSSQEIRFIDDIDTVNKEQVVFFKELDLVSLPD